ncbi:unnamed protein product, partial [Closterium sp. NIES-64]
ATQDSIHALCPRQGCTGWKVWFRQQQNRPNATDAWMIAHDPKHSGLKLLAFDMQEREADVCELHRIKYDYVGRFENYEHDYCSLVLSVAPLIAAFPI